MNDEHASRPHKNLRASCHPGLHVAAQNGTCANSRASTRPFRDFARCALPRSFPFPFQRRDDQQIRNSTSGELDETSYWLELMIDSGIMRSQRLAPLMAEANEIIAILVSSVRTIKRRRR